MTTITITGGYVMPEQFPAGAARYPEIVRYTAHLYDTSRLTIAEMWPLVRDVLAPRFADPLTQEQLRDRFDRAVAKMEERLGERRHVPPAPVDAATSPLPENRGQATLSDLGDVEYVEDLIRPGRIVVWAAEEGSGKSFAVSGELAIRVAAAGGTFAGTWPVVQRGRVLVLSEMHPDDDYVREETILESLDLDRRALDGTYFRLDLMAAAGGKPALTVPEWRDWIIGWLTEHEAILLVIDTATGATQVDPRGHAIQEVYANLRLMLAGYPYLAVILIVHVRKPAGRGGAPIRSRPVVSEDSEISLDRLIHEPARLAILTMLSSVASADFVFLQRSTGLTQGNLSSHLTKLEEAGLVRIEKSFVGKRPNTNVALTSTGRQRIASHWEQLDKLNDARKHLAGRSPATRRDDF